MNIGIFGAQGELGRNLSRRLNEIKPVAVELLPTVDRSGNAAIAAASDVAVIVVRPQQVEALFSEIVPHLKPDARVVSFAAYQSLSRLRERSGRPSARMMADPWWKISAFLLGPGFDADDLGFLFDGLTSRPCIQRVSDEEIDAFTVQMCQLFIALLLERKGGLDAQSHLAFLGEQFGATTDELRTLVPEGDADELIATISTKGGISETIALMLRENPTVSPAELCREVSDAFVRRYA